MKIFVQSWLKRTGWNLFPLILLFTTIIPISTSAQITACPDTSAALTPGPLQEEWALEWWMPRHEEKLEEEGREDAKLLLIGNSITHGWETDGKEVWGNYFQDIPTHNIGFSGDRTENVLWRFENGALDGLEPELAVLMIGTNNTGHRQDDPACTTKGIETILDELEQRLPDTHILLLAIFPRGETPDDALRQLNHEINSHIKQFNKRDGVTFLNINDTFLDDDGILSKEIMPDHLHPNGYGYQLWAEAMESKIRKLLGE